jgi:ElaB/YqjD/DUF883 family membrane-anchored ribosome-binding protein
MKYRGFFSVFMAALVVMSAGCSRPETPQQVATGFWQAIAEGKAAAAVELSTLVDASGLETLEDAQINSLPDFGRVVIEADNATIETILATNEGTGDAAEIARREITTYLVRVNDQWLVDYQRTREAMASRSSFSGLKEDLGHLRQQFDDAVGRSSEQIADQVDQLAKDFETYSEETGKKARQALDQFGESLDQFRKQIEESLDNGGKKPEESGDSGRESSEQTAI